MGINLRENISKIIYYLYKDERERRYISRIENLNDFLAIPNMKNCKNCLTRVGIEIVANFDIGEFLSKNKDNTGCITLVKRDPNTQYNKISNNKEYRINCLNAKLVIDNGMTKKEYSYFESSSYDWFANFFVNGHANESEGKCDILVGCSYIKNANYKFYSPYKYGSSEYFHIAPKLVNLNEDAIIEERYNLALYDGNKWSPVYLINDAGGYNPYEWLSFLQLTEID